MRFSSRDSWGRVTGILTVFSLCVLLLGLLALPASAVPNPSPHLVEPDYFVNSTADPGDGTCNATNCTLREAINAANLSAGSDIIAIVIPGSDPGCDGVTCTITLNSDLPAIDDHAGGTTINGKTQPDTNPNGPEVVVDGSSIYDCFEIRSAYNTIKGLVINQCDHEGIEIDDFYPGADAHHNTISGNYIGINAQGTAPSGNYGGIQILGGHDNTIGGTTDDARNIISGNEATGVFIQGTGADLNIVSGNYIGTSADGTANVGNGTTGIAVGGGAQYNTIGGDTSAERNIISGNGSRGIYIADDNSDGNIVSNNYIGTDVTGTHAVGNTSTGVDIFGGAQDNTIGPDNIIAYNSGDGVWVDGATTTGNKITRNSIHSNGGKGIELSGGANGNLPAPAVDAAICTAGSGSGGDNYEIEIFSDFDGQGHFYENTSLSISGNFAFFPAGDMFRHPYVTLTATDGSGNTSEFSAPYPNGCQFNYFPIITKGY